MPTVQIPIIFQEIFQENHLIPWTNFDCCCCPPGEIINIIIEEYVQHLSGYLLKLKFDPTLLFNTHFQYSNRIALEFSHLYHWHPLMPDSFLIDGDDIPYSQFMYNTSLLMHYGVEKLVEAFSHQPAGQVDTWLCTRIRCRSCRLFPQVHIHFF